MSPFHTLTWKDFPKGFTPFFLDPTGADLKSKRFRKEFMHYSPLFQM